MGTKGFQKGHIVSEETRAKISKAKDGNFYATCDYCGKEYHTKNLNIKNAKGIFAVVSAIRHIEKKLCRQRSKTLMVMDIV